MAAKIRFIAGLALVLCLAAGGGLAWAGPKDDIKAGNAAARAGDFARAVQAYTRAIDSGKLDPYNLAVAFNNRGSAKDDMGDSDGAIEDFKLALKVNPRYAEAYYNRSFAYERKGLLPLAVADIEKALRLSPDDPDYRDRLEYLNQRLARSR